MGNGMFEGLGTLLVVLTVLALIGLIAIGYGIFKLATLVF